MPLPGGDFDTRDDNEPISPIKGSGNSFETAANVVMFGNSDDIQAGSLLHVIEELFNAESAITVLSVDVQVS